MIRGLKREDVLVLAHYYTPEEVQRQADFVGDSFALAKRASVSKRPAVVFCGVSFMGESVKILCPEKEVYLPDVSAHCAMADMATEEEIAAVRAKYPDVAVVTYINSSARLKALSDVIVTSSNAEKIVSSLPNRHIYFIPDANLGRYIAARTEGKIFHFGSGCCPIHAKTSAAEVKEALRLHPDALFLTHPECPEEVCALADYVGSTAGIIEYAEQSAAREFLVGTEEGVRYELERRCPGKRFYFTREGFVCADMKKITTQRLDAVFRGEVPPVTVEEGVRVKAARALNRMMELAK